MNQPSKEQIERVAFELFNSDFGFQMLQQEWAAWPYKVKDYYRRKATVAILSWIKMKRRTKK